MLFRIGIRIRERHLTIVRADACERIEDVGEIANEKMVWLVISTICCLTIFSDVNIVVLVQDTQLT
jgi:hypothetical protein